MYCLRLNAARWVLLQIMSVMLNSFDDCFAGTRFWHLESGLGSLLFENLKEGVLIYPRLYAAR